MNKKLLIPLWIWKIMRLSFHQLVLCAVLCGASYAHETSGQAVLEKRVSLDVQGVRFKKVLSMLSEQADVRFVYSSSSIDTQQKVKLKAVNQRLDLVLEELLSPYSIAFTVSDSKMISLIPILPAKESSIIVPVVPELIPEQLAREVSGRVTDEKGEPLPGVNILIKGTQQGTATDATGAFSLTVPNDDAVLVFSFVGYLTREVTVESRTVLNISMEEDEKSLEELVVVGFGTQKQSQVTGSISSVKGEVINQVPAPSVEQMLSGRMAGVQVIQGSGAPGSGATIRVRGVGTLNNNEPLYVVDGIILGNVAGGGQADVSPLSLINPNDIESIDVLKDASASAIYGARAGNGVVIITTKRGAKDRINLSYDGYASLYQMDVGKYGMMNGEQWAGYYSKLQAKSGVANYQGKPFIDKVLAGTKVPEYDWLDELMRNGYAQSHNLSVSGGNKTSNYYSSLSYFDQTGVIQNSDLQRYTLRLNSDHKIKKIRFGNTLLISRANTNERGNVYGEGNTNNYIFRALAENPYKPVYDRVTGEYAGLDEHDPDAQGLFDGSNTHTIWWVKELKERQATNRVWASVYADYEITKDLTFHTMGSVDYRIAKSEERVPHNNIEGAMLSRPESNRLSFGNSDSRTWFIENTLTYNKEFSGNHAVTALLGYQAQNNFNTNFNVSAGGFEETDYWFFSRPRLMNPDNPGYPMVLPTVANGQSESAVVSFFGRLNYTFRDKYLLTATIRRDGSSRFGLDKRWGTFPAVSVGWRLSEESFMKDINWLTDLKVRGGYGLSGSDNVPDYQFASGVGQGGEFNYVFNGGEVPGATINRLANKVLRWEQASMADVGIDASLFNNRIDASLGYYSKRTIDMFLPYAPAFEIGMESNPNGNLGEVSNKGIDFSLTSRNFTGPFSWVTDLNFSTVNNKIISLPQGADRFASYNISRVGEQIGALYGYVMDGLFQNWDQVYSHAYQNQVILSRNPGGAPTYANERRDDATGRSFTAPGDIRYKDLNGDGIIEANGDRQIIGKTIPNFTWGLSNTLSYKGLGLSVFLQGVHGVSVYNALRTIQERNGAGSRGTVLLDAWDGENTSNSIPRLLIADPNNNERASTRFAENASFVRVKNVRLSYDLPRDWISKARLNQLQLYFTATNLFTFTQYSGYDPEIGLRRAGNNETAGVDWGTYPLTRQYTLGLRINL